MHIELIDPSEKLAQSLGGTGYLPPREPTPRQRLWREAAWAKALPMDTCVWKVDAASVDWSKGPRRATRRIRVDGRTLSGRIVGSTRQWYFVAVRATDVLAKLGDPA
jgi:hypothetical protein